MGDNKRYVYPSIALTSNKKMHTCGDLLVKILSIIEIFLVMKQRYLNRLKYRVNW